MKNEGDNDLAVLTFVLVGMLLAISLLSGCAPLEERGVKPFARLELGDHSDKYSDWWVDRERPDMCSKPPEFNLELGLEHKSGFYGYIYHESDLLCGSWNTDPEIDENGWRLGYQWGGW